MSLDIEKLQQIEYKFVQDLRAELIKDSQTYGFPRRYTISQWLQSVYFAYCQLCSHALGRNDKSRTQKLIVTLIVFCYQLYRHIELGEIKSESFNQEIRKQNH